MNRAFRTVLHRSVVASLALVALITPAFCTTWIVDINNGPGTNFTDIPPAIAAAAPGDVIIVRAGTYSWFILNRGITMLGQGTARTSAWIRIRDVPAGQVAVVRNLQPVSQSYGINVENCLGTVMVQRADSGFHVYHSSDVRLFDVTSLLGLIVDNSRVQVAKSFFRGEDGDDADCTSPAYPGGDGIDCFGASRMNISLSSALGGKGGLGNSQCFPQQPAASHGSGLRAGGIEIVLAGPGQFTAGGAGAYSAIFRQGVVAWSSNVTYSGLPPLVTGGATLTYTPTAVPTLERIGTPLPGAVVTLRLRAEPGTVARLNVGTLPALQPTPNVLVERMLVVQRSFDLGIVPPTGLIDVPWPYRQAVRAGDLLIFQANLVDATTGQVQRSNSLESIVE